MTTTSSYETTNYRPASTPVVDEKVPKNPIKPIGVILLVAFGVTFIVFLALYLAWIPKFEYVASEQQTFAFYQFFGKQFTNNGQPQIRCSNGTLVNILAASYSVYDPYLSCFPEVLIDLQDIDPNYTCGPYWLGGNGGEQRVAPEEPPEGTPYGWGGNGQCTSKDITPYLADLCNGRSECTSITIDSSFAPRPCNTLDPASTEYQSLPKGIPTSTPGGSDNENNAGFYVEGLYSCPPTL